jgi:TatD DNase family protein
MYVDVHCHLDDQAFQGVLDVVLERARAAGLKAIVSNGTGGESNKAVMELAAKHPIIRPAYGLYPTYELDDQKELAWIREQALTGKYPPAAIGEIGLDGMQEITEEQCSRFRRACQLAEELRLPIIVHSRKAEQEVFDELQSIQFHGFAVLHCFGGNKRLIKEGIERKYFFSVPANINKATHFQMLVALTPLSQLLTETDAPYLYPEEFPNEPANVASTVEHIAKIKNITIEECRQALFMNYQRVFS